MIIWAILVTQLTDQEGWQSEFILLLLMVYSVIINVLVLLISFSLMVIKKELPCSFFKKK